MNNLGLNYAAGRGVAPDAELAAMWLTLAQVHGSSRAEANLAALAGAWPADALGRGKARARAWAAARAKPAA